MIPREVLRRLKTKARGRTRAEWVDSEPTLSARRGYSEPRCEMHAGVFARTAISVDPGRFGVGPLSILFGEFQCLSRNQDQLTKQFPGNG